MDSASLFRRCLEIGVGEAVRGHEFGVHFDVFRYRTGFWIFWTGQALAREHRENRSIGIHCPTEDLLWAACSGDFARLENRRVQVFSPIGLIDPDEE